MSIVDDQYQDLIDRIDVEGYDKLDRTGVGTRSVFGHQMRFDISGGKLPLLTTKKVYTRAIIHELLWMLSGDTNIRYLKENNVNIWDSWIDPETAEYDNDGKLIAGDCPKVYGKQWRKWEDTRIVSAEEATCKERQGFQVVGEVTSGRYAVHRVIDQIANIVDQLKNNPDSRRIIFTAWNVAEIEEQALPPCHLLAQFWTREMARKERGQWLNHHLPNLKERYGELVYDNLADHIEGDISEDVYNRNIHGWLDKQGVPQRALSCQLYQRSADTALGVPFNIVQYPLLTHMLAHVTNMAADEFIWTGGDCHVYSDQREGLEEQLDREALDDNGVKLWLNPDITDVDDFTFDDIRVEGYMSHPPVKFPAAAV